jgi:hypothetical protein
MAVTMIQRLNLTAPPREPARQHDLITFAVDHVEPARLPLWTETRMDHLNGRFARRVLLLAEPERQVVNEVPGFMNEKVPAGRPRTGVKRGHPLIRAVHIAPRRRRNHVLALARRNWEVPVEEGVETSEGWNAAYKRGVARGSFPSGLSSVPVRIDFKDQRPPQNVDLIAGFLAVEQDQRDLALSPIIGWCLAEPVPNQPVRVF